MKASLGGAYAHAIFDKDKKQEQALLSQTLELDVTQESNAQGILGDVDEKGLAEANAENTRNRE